MTPDDLEGLYARLSGMEERFQARIATLDVGIRGQIEDVRTLLKVQYEDFTAQVKLVAEGHMMLAEGQERIIERVDRLEHDLTSLIVTAYQELDRRKQDKPQYRRRGH
jgi:hypothetical protein